MSRAQLAVPALEPVYFTDKTAGIQTISTVVPDDELWMMRGAWFGFVLVNAGTRHIAIEILDTAFGTEKRRIAYNQRTGPGSPSVEFAPHESAISASLPGFSLGSPYHLAPMPKAWVPAGMTIRALIYAGADPADNIHGVFIPEVHKL